VKLTKMVEMEKSLSHFRNFKQILLKSCDQFRAVERIRGVTILLLRATSQKTKKKASQILRSYGTDPHDMPQLDSVFHHYGNMVLGNLTIMVTSVDIFQMSLQKR